MISIEDILAGHASHPNNYFATHCKGCLWNAVDHVLKLDAYSDQAMKFLENVPPEQAATAYIEVSTALDNHELVRPFAGELKA